MIIFVSANIAGLWQRFIGSGLAAQIPLIQAWLQYKANLGLASNSIDAYGRAIEDYIRFCNLRAVDWVMATREHIGNYV